VFGKNKLLKNGAIARAAVLSSDMSGMSNGKGAHKWKLELKVQFDDGTTGEASCSAYEVNIGMGYGPGQIVPVRYDPKDRTKVEVDVPALQAERDARKREGEEGLARLAEERLARDEGREGP
jgi:hypothetical protein